LRGTNIKAYNYIKWMFSLIKISPVIATI
jgi:hypothetical protein